MRDLRHVAGTCTLANRQLAGAQTQLGHSRISMTKYAHIVLEEIVLEETRAATDRAHAPGESPEVVPLDAAKPNGRKAEST